jgi:putative DNA methylase
MQKRKLIEVALPLETINRESVREKSIRYGNPSTLHLWWARRPLAAVRAVLFAQLVDDPSARPEEFPTEELQRKERDRLHKLIERLVVWENMRDERLLAEAHAEILKSTDANPPPILDPFCGGGAIPLEAQRLGLEARGSDLNPVAVLITKALIELPPKFRSQPPVFPGLADSEIRQWKGAEGLAADVRAYGAWMAKQAKGRIGHLYPEVTLAAGSRADVIAWIWARTVICPNPACGIEMPLVRSWLLSKKKGKEAYVVPSLMPDPAHPSGRRVKFQIRYDATGPRIDGTMSGRQGAVCLACNSAVTKDHIKAEGMAGRMGAALMAVVAEGNRQRMYIPPTAPHEHAADVGRPEGVPNQELGYDPRNLWTPQYGLTRFSDLFTNRQLVALTTFSDLIPEAREKVLADALAAGQPLGEPLAGDGGGAAGYADAVATYLGLGIGRLTDRNNTICSWDSGPAGSKTSTGGSARTASVRNAFARQAIPMTWDFAESNPFSASGGSFESAMEWIVPAVERLPATVQARASQGDARANVAAAGLINTDPPYYDNIGYSDLSDFFYVWLRRSLRNVYPDLLSTVLVPKAEELVANPYRHSGKDGARQFFEDGFRQVFAQAREYARTDLPITVWYAFKQSESDAEGQTSTGWETLLEGMIRSGWEITSTWPLRSERGARTTSIGKNALASSIVLSLRPRPTTAPTTDRRGFIAALESELPDALRGLQQGQIAPVDLPQAAIGPGMAVFSRYSAVLEPDATKMTVRSALIRINEILDQVLNEQEGDFDATSRFAIAWYRQHGYGVGKFGDADILARALNTSVEAMERGGILTARVGKVQLIEPQKLRDDYDPRADLHTSNWEALHYLIKNLEAEGIAAAGDFLREALSRPDGVVDADLVKELAHLLFRIAEGNGWTKDALSFNSLVTSWPEILGAARSGESVSSVQSALDFEEGDD